MTTSSQSAEAQSTGPDAGQGTTLPLDPAAPLAVVIVNYNGGDKLLKTIQTIADQTQSIEKVVVVDSASDDGSPDKAAERYPQAQVIKLEDNVGPCVTRNTGVEQCAAPLVLVLDSDMYLLQDTIPLMLAAQKETGAAVVCPRIVLLPGADTIQCDGAINHFLGTSGMRNGWKSVKEVPPERASVPGAGSAALLIDRAWYQDVGGFDPLLYFYFEDLEFCLRTRVLGGDFVCEANAVVLHDRGSGTADLSFRGKGIYPRQRMYLQLRNRLILVMIYYRFRTLVLLAPALLFYEVISLSAAIAKRTGKEWFRAWRDALKMRKEVIKRRRNIQQKRVITDKELLTGGPIPLAPGFVSSGLMALIVRVLNVVFNSYWKLVRRCIG